MRRGSVPVAWRCMRAATVVVLLMSSMSGMAVVEPARPMSARETVAAIEQRARASTSASEEASVQVDGWRSNGDVRGDGVWDAEAESPPAQRQRDRSLWGMSKRLVPTGPNPLHN